MTGRISFARAAAVALVGLLTLAATLPLILTPGTAHGANFTVNNSADLGDANPGDGVCEVIRTPGICTLRAAIQEANALDGDDTIALPASTFTLTIAGAGENAAATGDLDITDIGNKLTIIGAGAAFTHINGGGIDRVFQVLSLTTLELSGVTITNGNAGADDGGGIFNGGSLTLTDSQVTNSTADNGGGIYNRAGTGLPFFTPAGSLTLNGSDVSGNSANGNGGGVWNGGTLTGTDATATANTAAAVGGGIFNSGTLTLTNSTVSDNTITTVGFGRGGGIFNASGGTAAITSSTINGNSAGDEGGGIWNGGTLTLTATFVVFNATQRGGGLYNASGASLSVSGGSFQGNNGGFSGGGIANVGGTVTMTDSQVIGNTAGNGGGIYHVDGSATLTDTTISNNTADGTTSPSGQGGGIYIARESIMVTDPSPTLVLT
ncbi:MAG: hypothetical protein V3V06_07630, partial [Dehalococcoidia bacterium]